MTRDEPTHVLLAGGGSGGHVFPALAVGAELASRGVRVSFAGAPQGMEARLVPRAGIAFHGLPARPLVGRGPLDKVRAAGTLLRSTLAARRLVRRLGADAVVGTGGYASAAAVLGARLARRPAMLVEPNARAGAANRFLSRFVAAAAIADPGAARDLACETELTGVPVRPEFFAVHEALPGAPAPALLVLGGSQGAQALNRTLPPALAAVAARGVAFTLVHQAGERHAEPTREAYAAAGFGADRVRVVPFVDDVAAAMAAADLVLSRAGAITLAEICAAGRPALLLPLAIAGGHQVENARSLAARGAAALLVPAEATPDRAAELLATLLADRAALQAMGRRARTLAMPGAAAAIADRALVLARRRSA